ncbi:MAG: hypothetical protein KDB14_19455, partial [Planctomycetales bacterium]|nr:hypothetical protein [Planctomycetales bacterium]
LFISGPSSYTGPTVIQQGTLRVQAASALQNSTVVEVQQGAALDVASISSGYVAPSGQTVSGSGQVFGSLVAASGSVVQPQTGFQIDDYALGVQAESMSRSSDWAVFNNNLHGVGAGGSYDGNGLSGSGIILVSNENTAAPLASTMLSTTVDIPESGTWRLFARIAAPSVSVVPGDISTGERGNNSVWVSGNPASLETTTSNFDAVQSLAAENFDAAVWTQLSPSLAALSGVWGPEDGGIDYSLAQGPQTFAVGGREVGTIVDGFVLSTKNLTSLELDAALSSGSVTFGASKGISISSNFTQQAGSLLKIELSENVSDALVVGGTASLSGDLDVELAAGFTPDPSDVFRILTAGNLVNRFANAADGARITASNSSGSFLIDYDYANDVVLLTDFQAGLAGDYNGDGVVDAADYTVWRDGGPLQNETQTPGLVTIEDYAAWRSNYGAHSGGGGGFLTAPEPMTTPLSLMAAGAVGWRRGRHRTAC